MTSEVGMHRAHMDEPFARRTYLDNMDGRVRGKVKTFDIVWGVDSVRPVALDKKPLIIT